MLILAWQASWGWVAMLFGFGIALAFAEIFIPSGGMLTLLSIGSFLGAVVVAFLIGQTPGIVVLAGTVLFAPLLVYLLIRIWPHMPVVRHLILQGPSRLGKAGDLARLDPEELKGKVGVAKTALRPSGKMTLDGRQIDCVTEGDMVSAGRKVRILGVHGSRVVVRPVEEGEA